MERVTYVKLSPQSFGEVYETVDNKFIFIAPNGDTIKAPDAQMVIKEGRQRYQQESHSKNINNTPPIGKQRV